jgi:hypothetical protein
MGCGSSNAGAYGGVGAAPVHKLRVLLLGPPAAGKSTIFKQLRIGFANSFSTSERMGVRDIVIKNMVDATYEILSQADARHDHLGDFTAADIDQLGDLRVTWSTEVARNVLERLMARGFQHVVAAFGNTKFPAQNEHTKHFLDAHSRILAEQFCPSDEDVVRARRVTIEPQTVDFDYVVQRSNGSSVTYNFEIIDVGGQYHDRRFWSEHYAVSDRIS